MKAKLFKFNYLRIITLLILSYNISFAQDSDSLQATPRDTTLSETVDSTGCFPWFYLSTGIGITAEPYYTAWAYSFHPGPAINFGIEIPFTSSHIFSSEVLSHSWAAKSKTDQASHFEKDEYTRIIDDIYSLFGLSWDIKWYFLNISNVVRVSIHAGYLLISSNKTLSLTSEYGMSIYYNLNEQSNINVSFRSYMIPIFDLFSADPHNFDNAYLPNVFMLNYCHRFNW